LDDRITHACLSYLYYYLSFLLIFVRSFFFYILNILQISYCLFVSWIGEIVFIYTRLIRRRRRHRFCTLGFSIGTETTGITGHCFKCNPHFQKLNYGDYSIAKATSSIDYFRRRIQSWTQKTDNIKQMTIIE